MSQQKAVVKDTEKTPFIISIGRQFGCGGREIGKMIAERLGADYYDKTLLSKAAEALGFDKRLFDGADEKRPSWIRSMLQLNYGVENAMAEFSDIDDEGLYSIQSRVINQLADKGPCVIVGRTADYILRDRPGLISIFLHAPAEYRIRKIMERRDTDTESAARSLARKMDNARESYYTYYTNHKWGHAETYHICLDTSRFSAEEIVDICRARIKALSQNR